MIRVDNARPIARLSRRSLRNSRTRNLIAIAAIVLTAVMFTTVFTVGASIVDSVQRSTMRQVGTSSHGGFKFLTWQQYEKVCADADVKDISYNIIVGVAKNPELQKTITDIRYTEEKAAAWSFNLPTTGTLPADRLDLATTTAVLDALHVPHKLGAQVPLTFITANGVTRSDTFTLCGFWEGDIVTGVNTAYVSRTYQEEVAPTWQDGQEYYDAGVYAGSVNVSLYFSSPWNIGQQMEALKNRCGFGPDVNEGSNWAYTTDTVDAGSLALLTGLMALIMLSGYLIIYNIFYLSVNGEIRFYGLLKTIGTTNSQLKRIVRRQALLLSAAGIPLGLGAGFALSVLLVPAVLSTLNVTDCVISVNPLIFTGSGLFTLLTVWIGCIRPGRLACRVSPVEAVRYTTDVSLKHSRKRTRKVTPFSMAVGNIRRTGRKTAAVVLSLSLSLILLNATVSLTRGFDMEKYLQDKLVSDFCVTDATVLNSYSSITEVNSITPKVRTALTSLDGVTESGCVYMREYMYPLSGADQARAAGILENYRETLGETSQFFQMAQTYFDEGRMPAHIYGVDGIAEEQLSISEGSFDRARFESGDYVIATMGGSAAGAQRLWEIGDTVTLSTQDGKQKNYEIMAIGDVPWALGPQHGHGFDAYFTLPSGEFTALTGETGAMNLALNAAPDKIDAIEDALAAYCGQAGSTLDYRSRQSYIDEFENMRRTDVLAGGLLSFLLALIGILNFINAVITSIRARRQELAVLQAVGMTTSQLARTLIGEGVCYILLTAFFSLTVGSILTCALMRGAQNLMWFFDSRLTVVPLLCALPVLLLPAAAVPALCCKVLCRHSVVERLRETET